MRSGYSTRSTDRSSISPLYATRTTDSHWGGVRRGAAGLIDLLLREAVARPSVDSIGAGASTG